MQSRSNNGEESDHAITKVAHFRVATAMEKLNSRTFFTSFSRTDQGSGIARISQCGVLAAVLGWSLQMPEVIGGLGDAGIWGQSPQSPDIVTEISFHST